ncbi:hybrid sensor histidine kinase/response regulator [Fimbriiglobus ruber]|nr:PAS domain S-box protein [Fimbriiglobus ruber]
MSDQAPISRARDVRSEETLLSEGGKRAREILESITDAFFALDRSWRFTYANRQSYTLLGRQPGDLLGHNIWEQYPGLYGSEFEHVYRDAMDRHQERTVTAFFPDHDRWYEVRTYPSDEGIAVYFRNVTDQKRGEEDRARLAAIVDSSEDAIISKSLDGVIQSWNAGAERLFEYTAGEAVGRSITLIIPAERLDEERSIIARIRQGERVEPFETVRRTKSGRLIDISITVSPVRGGDGNVIAASKVARDITERKRADEALREVDRKKDEFIALLAHELRNPLAPIRNGLQVLRMADDRASRDRVREMMDRQLSHMVRLVDDLLDVSRINQNKMELRRSRVLLADVIASAVETARPQIDDAGHDLTVSMPGSPVYLDADLTRLAQVFSNLLTNSAKYTERGGQIWLSTERRGTDVAVTVRDTGIGIPAESLGHIFDMFSQVDRSVERSTGGLGIGLALVKGLVEMHGGTVTVASEGQGKGSAFTVTLPVLVDRPAFPVASPAAGQAAARPKRHILVVDDNRDGAESLAMMLGLMGNKVGTANDGLAAVEQAEALRPEVILMDVGMPRLNGLEATRRIREQPWGKGITIIAQTGWGQDDDKQRSREAGCDGHLIKPVDLQDLEQLLVELDRK